jgi:hypothetical protein
LFRIVNEVLEQEGADGVRVRFFPQLDHLLIRRDERDYFASLLTLLSAKI